MAYTKAPKDPRGGHVRVYFDILDSPAWMALSLAERGLYVQLRRKLLGSNNGNIDATLGGLKESGIKSSATLAKGLRVLQAVGLLQITRRGGIAAGGKHCSLYRFTDVGVFEFPKQGIKALKATNDWKIFRTTGDAEDAIVAANDLSLRPATKEKRKLQNLKVVDSTAESEEPILDSISEQVGSPLLQIMNKSRRGKTPVQTA